jgi:hypothetical protein
VAVELQAEHLGGLALVPRRAGEDRGQRGDAGVVAGAAGAQVDAVPAADRPEPDDDVEAARVLVDREQHVEEGGRPGPSPDRRDRAGPLLPLDVGRERRRTRP